MPRTPITPAVPNAGDPPWLEKPACWNTENASAFADPSVARAYRLRPPYPAAVFAILAALTVDTPRRVLDVGCGNGPLARPLAPRVDHVDALDLSAPMIAAARRLPGGTHPHITWRVGGAEDAPLDPPYALVVAGASLHWMDWDVVLPRFARLLTPCGALAILNTTFVPLPWDAALTAVIARYSTIRNFARIDIIAALAQRGLFRPDGTRETDPVPFTQSLDDYVEAFHSASALSRERMSAAAAAAFDAAVRALVAPYYPEMVELQVVTSVVWGRPLVVGQLPEEDLCRT